MDSLIILSQIVLDGIFGAEYASLCNPLPKPGLKRLVQWNEQLLVKFDVVFTVEIAVIRSVKITSVCWWRCERMMLVLGGLGGISLTVVIKLLQI